MFLAVQKGNLELNIKRAVQRSVYKYSEVRVRRTQSRYRAYSAIEQGNGNTEKIIKICILAFPSLWVSRITMFGIDSGSKKIHFCLVFR
jgi:hypothetical protein